MKSIKLIVGVFAAASLLLSFNANAQENANRDENGQVVRGPYETNGIWDNTFVAGGIGLNGGWSFANITIPYGLTRSIGFAMDVNAGKWFTPFLGARLGWHGITNNFIAPNNEQDHSMNSLYVDAIWGLSNSIWGYKQNRKLDVNLYGGLAVSRIAYDNKTLGHVSDEEFLLHMGALATYPISERLALQADFGSFVMKSANYVTGNGKKISHTENSSGTIRKVLDKFFFPIYLTVGAKYELGKKTGFDRHSSVTPAIIPVPFTTEQYEDLSGKVAELEKENTDLKNKIAALEQEVAPLRQLVNGQTYLYENGTFTAVDTKAGAPVTLYFDCGSAVLSAREKAHLEYFTDNVLAEDTKLAVNGYADKQTGSARRNQQLSEQRVKTVVALLKKAGAKEENIETAAHGSSIQLFKGAAKNRVVTIEVK